VSDRLKEWGIGVHWEAAYEPSARAVIRNVRIRRGGGSVIIPERIISITQHEQWFEHRDLPSICGGSLVLQSLCQSCWYMAK